MAIYGRTPNECFDLYREHIAELVAKVVPTKCPMRLEKGLLGRRTLTFQNQPADDAVPLQTRGNGTVYLYMAQELLTIEEKARPAGERHRLRTSAYWYKLYSSPPVEVDADAVVRWEYKATERALPGECRHHMQFGRIDGRNVALGKGSMDVARVHLPTGWVLMEHVFRFLIHEFGVQPPCRDEWPRVLQESEDKFFGTFTGKGGQGYNPNDD
jgi:hypothetical protein